MNGAERTCIFPKEFWSIYRWFYISPIVYSTEAFSNMKVRYVVERIRLVRRDPIDLSLSIQKFVHVGYSVE